MDQFILLSSKNHSQAESHHKHNGKKFDFVIGLLKYLGCIIGLFICIKPLSVNKNTSVTSAYV